MYFKVWENTISRWHLLNLALASNVDKIYKIPHEININVIVVRENTWNRIKYLERVSGLGGILLKNNLGQIAKLPKSCVQHVYI